MLIESISIAQGKCKIFNGMMLHNYTWKNIKNFLSKIKIKIFNYI